MTIAYPNGSGKIFEKPMPSKKKAIEFGKRGMSFEEEINQSNEYYLTRGIAVIHKKPTPVQIVRVDYPSRNRAKITEAYFRQASTTDYNGVFQGKYLDFEAKETKNKTSFPFANFHEHQITHMENVLSQNGIAFVLLYFSSLNRVFFYPASKLIVRFKEKNTRKSIKLSDIECEGIEITLGFAPRIPYLDAVQVFLQMLTKTD